MLDMLGAVGEWRGIGKRGNRRGRDLPQGVGIVRGVKMEAVRGIDEGWGIDGYWTGVWGGLEAGWGMERKGRIDGHWIEGKGRVEAGYGMEEEWWRERGLFHLENSWVCDDDPLARLTVSWSQLLDLQNKRRHWKPSLHFYLLDDAKLSLASLWASTRPKTTFKTIIAFEKYDYLICLPPGHPPNQRRHLKPSLHYTNIICYVYLFDNIKALLVIHPTKDDMLAVQPGGLHCGDEELRSIGVL